MKCIARFIQGTVHNSKLLPARLNLEVDGTSVAVISIRTEELSSLIAQGFGVVEFRPLIRLDYEDLKQNPNKECKICGLMYSTLGCTDERCAWKNEVNSYGDREM